MLAMIMKAGQWVILILSNHAAYISLFFIMLLLIIEISHNLYTNKYIYI
jgi:hypothetical protein